MLNILGKRHAILVEEFDRYVMEHPEFAISIPKNSQIILQVEGDEEYNEWCERLGKRQRERGQSVVYVKVKGLKPVRSRLINPEVALV